MLQKTISIFFICVLSWMMQGCSFFIGDGFRRTKDKTKYIDSGIRLDSTALVTIMPSYGLSFTLSSESKEFREFSKILFKAKLNLKNITLKDSLEDHYLYDTSYYVRLLDNKGVKKNIANISDEDRLIFRRELSKMENLFQDSLFDNLKVGNLFLFTLQKYHGTHFIFTDVTIGGVDYGHPSLWAWFRIFVIEKSSGKVIFYTNEISVHRNNVGEASKTVFPHTVRRLKRILPKKK